MKIPFSPPDISEIEIQEVCEAMRSGWITTGPRVKELERLLADYIGTEKTCCLSSQTAAAEMALRVLGIGPGDEVITSAYTYTATASVVCHVGAKLVLVDTLPDSIEMDYLALENAITERTKVVIPVDLCGIPCDYEKVYAAVEKKRDLFRPKNEIQRKIGRIAVIVDAAHALGATYHGENVGTIADFSAFSFHAVKNFTTAEGGMLSWKKQNGIDSEEIYDKIQLLSLHGQNKDAFSKNKLGSWEYDIVGTWYKCNMTDIMAAIGIGQLKRYPEMLEKRKRYITYYDSELKPMGIQTLEHYSSDHQSSGHLYLSRVPGINEEMRNEIIFKMAERDIATNVHYKPLPMFTAYKELGFDIKDYPNAYDYYRNEITLPLYTKMKLEEAEYLIENYKAVLKGYL